MRALKHPSRLLIIFAVAACASGGRSDGRVRRDPNVITTAELSQVPDRTAYEAIERLRPRWLTARGRNSGLPSVIWDGRPYRLDMLRTMPLEQIETLAFISAIDATTLYGTGYPGGAIQVVSRRRR